MYFCNISAAILSGIYEAASSILEGLVSTKKSHILKQTSSFHLSAAGLFKYVWPFSGHRTLTKGLKNKNGERLLTLDINTNHSV